MNNKNSIYRQLPKTIYLIIKESNQFKNNLLGKLVKPSKITFFFSVGEECWRLQKQH